MFWTVLLAALLITALECEKSSLRQQKGKHCDLSAGVVYAAMTQSELLLRDELSQRWGAMQSVCVCSGQVRQRWEDAQASGAGDV